MRLKRYFTSHVTPTATVKGRPVGRDWHAVQLPGGGWLIVMMDGDGHAPMEWHELPHLLEGAPAKFNGTHAALGEAPRAGIAPICGCLPTDTTFQVARKLAAQHSLFSP